ncbi:50S ribosomal protein L13 [Chlamydiia bacterium]|nr:50S ribosomal protein L13 [Chlamydiia bacterium]MDA8773890.1 50S ribosomal protein L13 [Chlamydiia bacterium]
MNKKYNPQTTPTIYRDDSEMAWFHIDASGLILGRLASTIASILSGKHQVTKSFNSDTGDGVIVTNVEKIGFTGRKENKIYRKHTGWIGHLREETLENLIQRKPEEVLRRAVKGMMPRNKLSNAQQKRLRLFVGAEHNMEAQTPKKVN